MFGNWGWVDRVAYKESESEREREEPERYEENQKNKLCLGSQETVILNCLSSIVLSISVSVLI